MGVAPKMEQTALCLVPIAEPAPPKETALLLTDGPIQMTSIHGVPKAVVQTRINPDFVPPPSAAKKREGPARAVLHAKAPRLIEAIDGEAKAAEEPGSACQLLPKNPQPKSNIFKRAERGELAGILREFLTSADFYHPSQPFRAVNEGESPLDYSKAKTKHLMVSPKIVTLIKTHLIPSILRHHSYHQTPPQVLSTLEEGHAASLRELIKWHHSTGWKGMWALCPYPTLECTRYGTEKQPDMSSSAIEMHRRVLRIEDMICKLVSYVLKVMMASPCLLRLAHRDLEAALHCISAGSGVFGAGRDFWTSSPPPEAIAKLTQALASKKSTDNSITSQVEWLAGNRQAVFDVSYPLATEVDCWMHLLSIYFFANPLDKLDKPGNPEEFMQLLKADAHDRCDVYTKALEPLLLYGGRLTEYARRVYTLAKAFQALEEPCIQFPENCKMCEVNDGGYMLGLDSKPMHHGHIQLKVVPPIPFSKRCLDLKPLPVHELEGLVGRRRQMEEGMIRNMMEALGLSSSTVLDARNRANLDVARRLRDDSHISNLTHVLSPTASMPQAVYSPDVLFAA